MEKTDTIPGKQRVAPSKSASLRTLRIIIPFLSLVLIMGLIAILTNGRSIRPSNLLRLVIQAIPMLIAGIGASFTVSHGSLDFSYGSILAMCALVFIKVGEVNVYLAIPAAILTGIVFQYLVFLIHVSLKLEVFVGAMVIMFLGRGLVGSLTISRAANLPKPFYPLDSTLFYLLVLLVVFLLAYFFFEYTKVGKYNRAIGSNIIVADTSGVAISKYKLFAFIACGIGLGVAGVLTVLRTGVVNGSTGVGFETNIIIALVLGGVSLSGGTFVRLRSVILGVLLLIVLENGLVVLGLNTLLVGLVKGIMFIGAVAMSYDRKRGEVSK